jgi:hemerythrin-like domain-containing protein
MGSGMPRPLDTLRSEHASIRVVIDTLRRATTSRDPLDTSNPAVRPATILAYLDAFLCGVHAPKEDGPFCLRMLRRSPMAWPVVAGSRRDHGILRKSILALEQRLLEDGDTRATGDAVAEFAARCLRQLARQEAVMFPLAVRVLGPDDWQDLDRLFAGSIDPLAGIDRAASLRTLLARIDAALPQLHPASFPEA